MTSLLTMDERFEVLATFPDAEKAADELSAWQPDIIIMDINLPGMNGIECIKKVKTFTEKPDHEMAKLFVQSGDFLWNAGIFIWSAKSIVKAYQKLLPEMAEAFEAVKYNTAQEEEGIKTAYASCKNISVDYGILEKADNVYVRSSLIGWSDLGTYGSLYNHIAHDDKGNAIVGKNVMMYDSKDCIVNISKDKLVVVEGLQDYIVVESDDIILICKKQDEQRIRDFVNDVKLKKGEKFV